MSSLKNFIQAPSNNFPGDMAWSIGSPSSGWLEADGSIVSQAAFPTLFAQVGLLPGVYNPATEFILPNPPLIFIDVPNEAHAYIKGD